MHPTEGGHDPVVQITNHKVKKKNDGRQTWKQGSFHSSIRRVHQMLRRGAKTGVPPRNAWCTTSFGNLHTGGRGTTTECKREWYNSFNTSNTQWSRFSLGFFVFFFFFLSCNSYWTQNPHPLILIWHWKVLEPVWKEKEWKKQLLEFVFTSCSLWFFLFFFVFFVCGSGTENRGIGSKNRTTTARNYVCVLYICFLSICMLTWIVKLLRKKTWNIRFNQFLYFFSPA